MHHAPSKLPEYLIFISLLEAKDKHCKYIHLLADDVNGNKLLPASDLNELAGNNMLRIHFMYIYMYMCMFLYMFLYMYMYMYMHMQQHVQSLNRNRYIIAGR